MDVKSGVGAASGDTRDYRTPRRLRVRRHVRAHGTRAVLLGTTGTGVLAGFLSASDYTWPLLAYLGVVAASSALILVAIGLPTRAGPAPAPANGPASSRTVRTVSRAASVASTFLRPGPDELHDPVYGAGLRALLPPSRPLLVISSNRRDVGRDHELPLPLFAATPGRPTCVDVDPREFGIPLRPYSFEREQPEGGQDVDHTLAVKDLVFMPELAAALGGGVPDRPTDDAPVMLPEHCVDPQLLAERDVVVIGGPDTNFWHGALFEPVAREFAVPRSPVPLALQLRSGGSPLPSYGSRSMGVRLAGLGDVLPHSRDDETDLDERLFPTYGMALAARNPYAAALGRAHWVLFVAGTRSLGTSGVLLGLTRMLRAMRADDGLNFASHVPSAAGPVPVSAALFRVGEVQQPLLRRGGELTPRQVRALPPSGLDPQYSDGYVPTVVEYLSYGDGSPPTWRVV
ncbi:hypothetical protein ACIB24_19260 [Spongisporangium articulatum]|uniref:Uncharacterized protein n=1 Tax=Spongisporangium articulatum TaxID=3362603 RepID=A0ABW8AS97_9ACTN